MSKIDIAVKMIEKIDQASHTFPLLRTMLPKQISDDVIWQALKQLYPQWFTPGDVVEEFMRIHTPEIGEHPYTSAREMIIVGYRTVHYLGCGNGPNDSYPVSRSETFDVIFPGITDTNCTVGNQHYETYTSPDVVHKNVAGSLQMALVCAAVLQNLDNVEYIQTVAGHFLNGFSSSGAVAMG